MTEEMLALALALALAKPSRAGARLGVSDVVADDALSPAQRAERGS
ncbi:hypothetical protein [Nonomuraea turkmeniaca]|nr:hypothetical protein [Nonomuraea turkmeniaca]